jgi:hypothetical protein
VVGDLARIDDVRRLADQAREHGPIDAWVHNPGVWVRGSTPRTSADGHETTFAVTSWRCAPTDPPPVRRAAGTVALAGLGPRGVPRPQPAALGRRPIRGGRAPRARRATLPRPWPGIVDCRTSSRWPSTRGGSRPSWPAPASGRRQIVRGHHRLLPHGTRPGLGALLEEPSADTGPRTAAGPPSRMRSSRPAIEW